MTHRFNLKTYVKDTSGQFSVMFALGASVLMMGTAAAVDMTNLQKTHSRMNDIADAAALAGAAASELRHSQREKVVKDALLANTDAAMLSMIDGEPVIRFDDTNSEVTVSFNIKSKPLLAGIFGYRTLSAESLSVASYAQSSVSPVSISFALDVSGSMGWPTSDGEVKIQALKDSVNAMFLEIESEVGDPRQLETSMRTGMSTYNTALRSRSNMNPGWKDVGRAVNRLTAGGGTNSTPSLDFAHTQITRDRQYRQINDPAYNPSTTKEFVIFMTDGDNNRTEWDDSSQVVCDQMKNDGIEVFTVAFAAPAKGQLLLENCASDDKDAHYFDASNAQAFHDAFRQIGKEIVERSVRIKS